MNTAETNQQWDCETGRRIRDGYGEILKLLACVQLERDELLKQRRQLIAGLESLMACFNDEGELAERYQDQLSVAWEKCEKLIEIYK